jgi:predicted O-linked N-acetylglucosamine transferase (SPINDLY family)
MDARDGAFMRRLRDAAALADRGELRPAIERLRELLRERPNAAVLRQLLARCHLRAGEPAAALASVAHASLIADRSTLSAAVADLAAAGALRERAALLEAAARYDPRDYDAAIALAASLHALGCPSAALRWSTHAAALRPSEPMPRAIAATALVDRGDVEAGLAAYRALLAAHADAEHAARHLVLMHYDPALDAPTMSAAIRAFARRFLPSPEPLAPRPPPAGRRLRIGWASPRFDDGPVATFLAGLLRAFDRERHEHVLVDLAANDARGARSMLRDGDTCVDAGGLDDEALLQRLRALQLDVLVDLAGHSTANRLRVIARRVAPLQLTWLDWFDTTGVAAIDLFVGDPWLTPSASTPDFSETIANLPSGRFCYTPPRDDVEVSHAGGGGVVFASFNRLAKLNDRVLDAWAQILHRCEGSRLLLHARHLGEAETRTHVADRFAARGIAASRLELGGPLPYRDLLEAYRRVDIALDPFPFSGCTTSCDALWMGSAVVTLEGNAYVGRQSASLLHRLGLIDWIATDVPGYVAAATRMAAGVERLRAARADLRQRVLDILCDAPLHAEEFARMLHARWHALT